MLFDHDFESIYPVKVDSITIGGTTNPGALNLPSGLTTTRTTAPVAGSFRYNTTIGGLEFYNGTTWSTLFSLASQAAATVLAAPANTAGVPTFRLQALTEHSDVVITNPTTTQLLTYNGTNWINSSVAGANAAGTIGVSPSGGGTGWTLVTGSTTNRYYADFVHNIGTTNVVITVYNIATNAIVIPDEVVLTDGNSVRVTIVGNTRTLKIVVIANGSSIAAGGSTPSSVITAYEGVTVTAAATKLNFVGSTVVADTGGGTTTVSIGARFTHYANSFDTPNNSDWAVNAFAPVTVDPTYMSMNVRSFVQGTETGVGFMVTIPTGATLVNFRYRLRPSAAPAVTNTVQFRVYFRPIPNNAVVGTWQPVIDLPVQSIPANANFQYFLQSATLAQAGLTAGQVYQVELTRKTTVASGTNYAGNVLLAETTFEFA